MHSVLFTLVHTYIQDLYEERRNQFFSNLGDVEEWLKQTKEVVQEALLEEKEQQERDSEEQSAKVVKQAEAFQGVASQQSESDRQAVMDDLISTLKVTLIQWSLQLIIHVLYYMCVSVHTSVHTSYGM